MKRGDTMTHSYKWELHIEGNSITVKLEKRPNAWRRFWQWALLGWVWRGL
jgi:hypothetical protein